MGQVKFHGFTYFNEAHFEKKTSYGSESRGAFIMSAAAFRILNKFNFRDRRE
jgi:hypothetical protein